MKKLLAVVLTLAMLLSLAACAKTEPQASETPAETPAATEAPATEPAAEPEPEPEAPKLTPAYSVEGFETVDADGNRITTGRDATAATAMATASKYEVSQVGAEIMQKGGNAVDAAVAMGFALGVCEPFTSGLGGGGLCTIHTASGENYFIDFREVAPAAATLDLYLDAEGKSNGGTVKGGLASGVPGEVAGMLYLLENYGSGKLTRQEVMEPAIRIATEGFTVSQYCANAIADAYEKALEFPEMQEVYWNELGLPYETGDVIVNPGLAKALQKIADEGRDGFYKGEIAQAVVDTLTKYGGVMTTEDLANYEVMVHEPVTGSYRGYQVISSPPPSSGGTHLIEILNILENFDVGALKINSADYIHLFAETFKLSYADRAQYMADTAFADVPLTGLTSKEYAKERAALIDLSVAKEPVDFGDPTLFEHTDTTHYSVADAEGNCVAITKTINYYFGSGVMVGGWGFMMNNQMDDFSTDPESVNKIEPGKKPLSSMSPTVVLKEDGSPFMVLGTPGGARIFASVAQVISRVIDHDIPLHDAICIPKIWNNGPKNNLQYEVALKGYEDYAVTDETLQTLVDMGHGEIKTAASGAVQAIEFLEDGSLYGTADPRQDGKAVGF
ncbi:MAG: gamma-glutamyltransferase [Oscillospiraceae bacterium]|nr:gamma-glutamyltransferase [Oscillospiraceae bacterium]